MPPDEVRRIRATFQELYETRIVELVGEELKDINGLFGVPKDIGKKQ